MDVGNLLTAIISGVGAGIVSAIGTVAALGVRVDWVRETANRAHARLDEHDKTIKDHGNRIVALEGKSK